MYRFIPHLPPIRDRKEMNGLHIKDTIIWSTNLYKYNNDKHFD